MSETITLGEVTPKSIKQIVSKAYCADNGYSDDDLYEEAVWEIDSRPVEYAGLFISTAQQTGGGEGSGEYMDVVWKFSDGESVRFFKETGRYCSFVGGEWNDDMHEVGPKQVEVTVYE
jgi:hypothetical protein